ncbi:Lrp/AsnC family transcriptional regulator [Desulfotalea psychrophila]|uniref:Related to transcription regulator n=1 Tax=Desulfotalea psychrophila (strain LSv54 / DSM 12343) TaxID=177439 RepID=Q6ARJ4_DESPS|nr:Lrp/AsnC family transcriptional regulator [Desulfotalea psychrophila]CAG35031.1 related to transcription regulator [Desulfotalea psychrophila LSv54]
MKLDKINIAILEHLRDGRMAYKKIAENLSVAEGTIRSRVKKMQDEGVLQITGLIDPDLMPEQSVIMVGVRVKDMNLVKKGEEFSRLRGVISVCVVTGRYDLILTVALTSGFSMLEFYNDEVCTIDNVGEVETFVVYKSFNVEGTPLTLGEGRYPVSTIHRGLIRWKIQT